MFDANMRYLPEGKRFFAEGRSIAINHPLIGLYDGSHVFLCTMLSKDHENPLVRFHFGDEFVDISDSESGTGSWFVYAGNVNGTGFIHDDIKNKALGMIDGWEDR